MAFDLTDFKVGDEFEGSARELGIIISSILADGGSFSYEGRSVRITALPDRSEPAPKKVEEPVQAVTEVEAPATVEPEAPAEPAKVEPEVPAEPPPSPKKPAPTKTFNAPRKKT